MNDVEITCTPGDGILTLSAETVAALDALALTLPGDAWKVTVHTSTAELTALPAMRQEAAA